MSASQAVSNGDFEGGNLNNWETNDWSNDPNLSIASSVESSQPLTGSHSAKIDITGTSAPANHEHWEVNVRQIIGVVKDRYYEGSFTVRANQECTFWVQVYKTGGNYDTFVFKEFRVSDKPQTIRFGGVANFTSHPKKPNQQATLQFGFGKTERGRTIWLDDISLVERSPAATTATVTVDVGQGEQTAPLSGLLLGLQLNIRVSATTNNPEIIPLASTTSGYDERGQVLVASRSYSGPAQDMNGVTVDINNLSASGLVPSSASNVYVSVHRAAYFGDGSGAVVFPEQLSAAVVTPVNNDSISVDLNDVNAYDVQRLSFGMTQPYIMDGFEFGDVNAEHDQWIGHNYNPQFRGAHPTLQRQQPALP